MENKALIEELRKRYGIPKIKGKLTGYDLARHPLIEKVIFALLCQPT